MTESIDEAAAFSLLAFPEGLTFVEQGLLGLEHLRRFTLEAYAEDTPFYWLRSEEEPDMAFLVMEPGYFIEDYAFDLADETLQALQIEQPEDVGVLVLLSIPENPLAMTANLLGPIVYHRKQFLGKQVVLDPETYPLQYPVLQEADDARSHP